MRVFGIIGWKDAGKTGLTERLVAHLTARGLRVSTVKHSHHDVDPDPPGTDSARHRAAGAAETLLCGPHRLTLTAPHTTRPDLPALLARLAPADLVLVEGFKSAAIPKVEVWRAATGHPLIQPGDAHVRAVAAVGDPGPLTVPVLNLDDTAAIAALILRETGLDRG